MRTLLLCLFLSLRAHAAEVPDYAVRIGLDPASKVPRWLIEALPPKGFHFNLKAGTKITAPGKKASFTELTLTEARLGFSSSSIDLKEGDALETAFYLCDQGKTLCVRKTLNLPLKVNSDLTRIEAGASSGPEKPGSGSPSRKRRKPGQKDGHGFYVNDPEAAIREASRTRKPLLIDFFGIWCPPCNLYSETVFPDARFKKAAKRFVLLGMDADDERSFELKSRFKVGGYPTMIIAEVSGEGASSDLRELSRIVGYYPVSEFVARLESSLKLRGESMAGRALRLKGEYLASLRTLLALQLEQHDAGSALKTAEEGLRMVPDDLSFRLSLLEARKELPGGIVWGDPEAALLDRIRESRSGLEAGVLSRAVFLILDSDSKAPEMQLLGAGELLAELERRIDSKTLSVPGTELLLPDLASFRMDRARLLDHPDEMIRERKSAIEGYKKLVALHPGVDSRGLNLELAALLVEDGRLEDAGAIYDRFMKRYPDEFTFYYAAARMYLGTKDFPKARDLAEKAFERGYGDNRIRAMDRLVKVMGAQGESGEAVRRGRGFLKDIKFDPKLSVRTGRYVAQLEKSLSEIEKESKK